MEFRPIRNETDYQEALREIELMFNAAPNTPEYDRLDVLSTLLEVYEKKHIPIAIPDRSDLLLHGNSRMVSSRFRVMSR